MNSVQFTFVDLFSGAGGFLRGFMDAGFEPLFSVENWKPAIDTHKTNYSNVPLLSKDIREISNQEFIKSSNGKKAQTRLFHNGKCTWFGFIKKWIFPRYFNRKI